MIFSELTEVYQGLIRLIVWWLQVELTRSHGKMLTAQFLIYFVSTSIIIVQASSSCSSGSSSVSVHAASSCYGTGDADINPEYLRCIFRIDDMTMICHFTDASCKSTRECRYNNYYGVFECDNVSRYSKPKCCFYKCCQSGNTYTVLDTVFCDQEQNLADFNSEYQKCAGDMTKINAVCNLEFSGWWLQPLKVSCPYTNGGWKCKHCLDKNLSNYCCKYKCMMWSTIAKFYQMYYQIEENVSTLMED